MKMSSRHTQNCDTEISQIRIYADEVQKSCQHKVYDIYDRKLQLFRDSQRIFEIRNM